MIKSWLHKLGYLKKNKAVEVVEEPVVFTLEEWQKTRYRQVLTWIVEGYPVLVSDPEGGDYDGVVIYSVMTEAYWIEQGGPGRMAFALNLKTRSTVHIPTDQPQLTFLALNRPATALADGLERLGPRSEYQMFLDEVSTLPIDHFNHYTIPLNIDNPAEGGTGKVAAQIMPNNRFLAGCEAARLPSYLVIGGDRDERSKLYYYGIDAVPRTALELRTCIETTESVLERMIQDIELECRGRITPIKERLEALRTDTKFHLTVTDRYDALIEKYPALKSRPRLRNALVARHVDIDEFQVPYTRDQLPKWFAEVKK